MCCFNCFQSTAGRALQHLLKRYSGALNFAASGKVNTLLRALKRYFGAGEKKLARSVLKMLLDKWKKCPC